jgi:catechol 2,3-dioxygenase-like lactoylglutathione lyase family enzyme
MIYAIDHVQIAIPPGGETQARAFYCDVLRMRELPKPAELAKRGGLWLAAGDAILHLGVDADFKAAARAHPAFLVRDLDAMMLLLTSADVKLGHEPTVDGYVRVHVFDPFGNRIELMQKL